jgi:hypothetical protein
VLTQYQDVVHSFLDAALQPGILFDIFVDLQMNGTLGIIFEEQVRDQFSLANAQVVTPMLEREVIEYKEDLVVNTVNNILREVTVRT